MTLTHHVAGFNEFLRANLSESTRYAYTCRTRTYLATLEDDSQFTHQHVNAYKHRLQDRLRPRGVSAHLSAIKAFGEYLVDEGVLTVNPAARVKMPALDAARREVPTDTQVLALFAACSRIHHPFRRALATAVVSALAYAGVRRGELLALKLGDIDQTERRIIVRHGKGNKYREIDIDAPTVAALTAYLALRPTCVNVRSKERPKPVEDRLWLLRAGYAMGDEGLRTLLRELAASAGLPGCRAILPHGFRHGYASRLRRGGAELEEIGAQLGHSDIKTTRDYLHNTRDRMREVAAMAAIPMPIPGAAPADQPAPEPEFTGLRHVKGGLKDDTQKGRPGA